MRTRPVKTILLRLLRLIARLPLPVLHLAGALTGIFGLLRPRLRRTLRANLTRAGLYQWRFMLRVACELGRGVAELPRVWLAPLPRVFGLVREVQGWPHLEAARAAGRGVVLLCPHLGNWELCGMYIAHRVPCTALYTPPRQPWVHALMRAGRERSGVKTVPPGTAGVRALLRQLQAGECVLILPDQTAGRSEGLWLPFLGTPAFMPALPYRLVQRTGAAALLVHARRLPRGRGFSLEFEPLALPPGASAAAIGDAACAALSTLIRRHPQQYLWNYRLWRRKGDTPPPPEPA